MVAATCRAHGCLLHCLGGIGAPTVFAAMAELGACPLLITGMDTDLLYAAVQSRAHTVLRGVVMTTVPLQTTPMRVGHDQHTADVRLASWELRRALPRLRAWVPPRAQPALHVSRRHSQPLHRPDRGAWHLRFVLVQPTFYGTDNRLTLDVLRRVEDRCRAVARVDEDVADGELDEFHELGVRALRLDLFARSAEPTARSSATYAGWRNGPSPAAGTCSSTHRAVGP